MLVYGLVRSANKSGANFVMEIPLCRGTVGAGELQNSQASNKPARDSNDRPLVIFLSARIGLS